MLTLSSEKKPEWTDWGHLPLEHLLFQTTYTDEDITAFTQKKCVPEHFPSSLDSAFPPITHLSDSSFLANVHLAYFQEKLHCASLEIEAVTLSWENAENEWNKEKWKLEEKLQLHENSIVNHLDTVKGLNDNIKDLTRKLKDSQDQYLKHKRFVKDHHLEKKNWKKVVDILENRLASLEQELSQYTAARKLSLVEGEYGETRRLQNDNLPSVLQTGTVPLCIQKGSMDSNQNHSTKTLVDKHSVEKKDSYGSFVAKDSTFTSEGVVFETFSLQESPRRARGCGKQNIANQICSSCWDYVERLHQRCIQLNRSLGKERERSRKMESNKIHLNACLESQKLDYDSETRVLPCALSTSNVEVEEIRKELAQIVAQLESERRLYQSIKQKCGLAIAKEIKKLYGCASSSSNTNFKRRMEAYTQTIDSSGTEHYTSAVEMEGSALKVTRCYSVVRVITLALTVCNEVERNDERKAALPRTGHRRLKNENGRWMGRKPLPLLETFERVPGLKSTPRAKLFSASIPLIPVHIKPSKDSFLSSQEEKPNALSSSTDTLPRTYPSMTADKQRLSLAKSVGAQSVTNTKPMHLILSPLKISQSKCSSSLPPVPTQPRRAFEASLSSSSPYYRLSKSIPSSTRPEKPMTPLYCSAERCSDALYSNEKPSLPPQESKHFSTPSLLSTKVSSRLSLPLWMQSRVAETDSNNVRHGRKEPHGLGLTSTSKREMTSQSFFSDSRSAKSALPLFSIEPALPALSLSSSSYYRQSSNALKSTPKSMTMSLPYCKRHDTPLHDRRNHPSDQHSVGFDHAILDSSGGGSFSKSVTPLRSTPHKYVEFKPSKTGILSNFIQTTSSKQSNVVPHQTYTVSQHKTDLSSSNRPHGSESVPTKGWISYALDSLHIAGGAAPVTHSLSFSITENLMNQSRRL